MSAFFILLLFSFALYYLFEVYFIDKTDVDLRLNSQYVQSLISKNSNKIYPLTKGEIESLQNVGLVVFVSKITPNQSNKIFPSNLNIGFSTNKFDGKSYRFFHGVQDSYSFVIGKDLTDFFSTKTRLKILLIYLNLVFGLMAFVFAYSTGDYAMKPLKILLSVIKNLDVKKMDQSNNFDWRSFGDDDLGRLAKQFSRFIEETQFVFKEQKEFLEDASHELRTPLMVMSSSLEFLESTNLPPKKKEKLLMISQSVERMKMIVENLLFLTRGESNDNIKEDIDVGEFVRGLISNYDLLIKEKKIKVSIDEKYKLILNVSLFHLDRLISNLVKNAIAYNNDNGLIKIIIDKKRIIISDSGIGIDKNEVDKIWNRFYRGKQGVNTNRKGVGLGLSIAKKIADINNWTIKVNSDVGKGTEFVIQFS
ncbi:MAG: HAMP domain-containing sensor histidine kinase [Candidatus Absconditabacteria bacterium]